MTRAPVTSSHIVSIGHDGRRTLEVEFRGGKLYRYDGVPPEVYRELLEAESVGSALAQKVIGKYPHKIHNQQEDAV